MCFKGFDAILSILPDNVSNLCDFFFLLHGPFHIQLISRINFEGIVSPQFKTEFNLFYLNCTTLQSFFVSLIVAGDEEFFNSGYLKPNGSIFVDCKC